MAYFVNMYQYILNNYELFGTLSIFFILIYVCFNLYKKVKVYEEWVAYIKTSVNKLQTDIHNVDEKKLFENDDDVGFVYENVSSLVRELDIMVDTDKKEQ